MRSRRGALKAEVLPSHIEYWSYIIVPWEVLPKNYLTPCAKKMIGGQTLVVRGFSKFKVDPIFIIIHEYILIIIMIHLFTTHYVGNN